MTETKVRHMPKFEIPDCGCLYKVSPLPEMCDKCHEWSKSDYYHVKWCPLHKAAPGMYAALKALEAECLKKQPQELSIKVLNDCFAAIIEIDNP